DSREQASADPPGVPQHLQGIPGTMFGRGRDELIAESAEYRPEERERNAQVGKERNERLVPAHRPRIRQHVTKVAHHATTGFDLAEPLNVPGGGPGATGCLGTCRPTIRHKRTQRKPSSSNRATLVSRGFEPAFELRSHFG